MALGDYRLDSIERRLTHVETRTENLPGDRAEIKNLSRLFEELRDEVAQLRRTIIGATLTLTVGIIIGALTIQSVFK